MQAGGDNAVAVVGCLSVAEVVASADGLYFFGETAPFAVVLQHPHILFHLTDHRFRYRVLVKRGEGDEALGVEGIGDGVCLLELESEFDAGVHPQREHTVS